MKPNFVATSVSRGLCLFVVLTSFSTAAFAAEMYNVEYLCADWGPAMKLPSKPGDKLQFSDTEEEIYFLKQVMRFTRHKLIVADPFSGNKTADTGRGVSIYLCKMKPDGSGKTEIKELWKNPNYPIDTQGQSTWMDVNAKTRKIVLSVLFAGTDEMGLWTMNLDGSGFKQILKPEWGEHLVGVDHPNWTPDGQWIVFAEIQRGTHPNQLRIAKCDSEGKRLAYLTPGPWQEQPAVSPDGNSVVYGQVGDAKTGGLYLIGIDGKNERQMLDPAGKPIAGIYPAWSPDGKRIFAIGMSSFIAEAATGKKLIDRSPQLDGKRGVCGWSHWGGPGFVGNTVGGILLTDSELNEAKWLASSGLANCSEGKASDCRW